MLTNRNDFYIVDCRQWGEIVEVFEKNTYKDLVVKQIYHMILNGEMNSGDRVVESSLSKNLGISRAPVREALRELITEGILKYKPQVGYYVTEITKEQILDTYETRGLLEGYAIRTALDLFSGNDLDNLKKYINDMEFFAYEGEHLKFIEAGGKFHEYMFCKSPNIELVEFTKKLSHKSHIFFNKYWMKIYSPENIRKRHECIIDTISKKDGGMLETVIRDHYMSTAAKISEVI